MATIGATVTQPGNQTVNVLWEAITEADDGRAVDLTQYPDRTVQVYGDFTSSGAITMQGSADGSTWGTLHDPQGEDLVITDATPRLIAENTKYIRPHASAGTSVAMSVLVVGSR